MDEGARKKLSSNIYPGCEKLDSFSRRDDCMDTGGRAAGAGAFGDTGSNGREGRDKGDESRKRRLTRRMADQCGIQL